VSWHVYMLRCADQSLYTGITNDLTARLDTHNAGKGAKYTRGRGPVELVYAEPVADQGSALRREAELKRWPRRAKLALIATHEPIAETEE
jgi:putative endonuclease